MRAVGPRLAAAFVASASLIQARSSTCWFSVDATVGQSLRLIRKLLKKQGFAPKLLVTGKLCS